MKIRVNLTITLPVSGKQLKAFADRHPNVSLRHLISRIVRHSINPQWEDQVTYEDSLRWTMDTWKWGTLDVQLQDYLFLEELADE